MTDLSDRVDAAGINGLHDAQIKEIAFDLVQRTILVRAEVCMDDPDADGHDVWCPAEIKFSGISRFTIDGWLDLRDGVGRADFGDGIPPRSSVEGPATAATHWIYMTEPNTFVVFDAADVSIRVSGPTPRASLLR